ncbi:MAG: DUF1552 domain-containing protein [Pseudomonadota bacterium]
MDSLVIGQTLPGQMAGPPKSRFIAIEMVHGAAGSTAFGRENNLWSPAREGANFEFTPTLKSLEPFREYITVISNTDLKNATSLVPDEDGDMADHARSSAVFLTGAHPTRSAGSHFRSGPSIDQLYAQFLARETPLASLQLCIEDAALSGTCGHGYSCAYTHTMSWASANRPLSMERAPRAVFERLFAGRAAKERDARLLNRRSVLDGATTEAAALERRLGANDRHRVREYFSEIREIELRIQEIEKDSKAHKLPNVPSSVPDSFDDHVKLMFDLQILAFMADMTRVTSFKMGLDRSQRIYPESGVSTPFHTLSHHRESPEKIEEFARLNQYHVSKVAYFLDRLRSTPDGDGNLLDHAVVAYGSPMGDSHTHGHKFLPLFLAGRASGGLKGNLHVRCRPGTPMANVWLTLLHKFGVNLDRIGDSSGEIPI